MHQHVYKFYVKDYNKITHGTIDHKLRNPLDCTIESLRAATRSLQAHNVKKESCLGYHGISLNIGNFLSKFDNKSKKFEFLEDALLYFNNLVNEKYGFDKNGQSVGVNHIIPNTKTLVKDLYSKEKLNLEKIDNLIASEVKSIFYVNDDWRKEIGLLNLNDIKKENIDYYITKIKDLLY